MSIKVLFNDLRIYPLQFNRHIIDWFPGMRADEVVKKSFPISVAERIIDDLNKNNQQITVSWLNDILDQRSEVGGVESFDWQIPDKSILIIIYQDDTTSKDSVEQAISWMMEDEDIPW